MEEEIDELTEEEEEILQRDHPDLALEEEEPEE